MFFRGHLTGHQGFSTLAKKTTQGTSCGMHRSKGVPWGSSTLPALGRGIHCDLVTIPKGSPITGLGETRRGWIQQEAKQIWVLQPQLLCGLCAES